MPDAIHISESVLVPPAALSMRAVRSSGPGGQNVNKVASRVELRVDLAGIIGLGEQARARLERLVGRRLDADGRWLVTSQRTRDQGRNLEDAREKVREAVGRALVEPRRRRATRPTTASKARRLDEKKRQGEIKRARRAPGDE
jgi:ribosome-associated protein